MGAVRRSRRVGLKSAIEEQQEGIKVTGRGRPQLALLYLADGDQAHFLSAKRELQAPGGDEGELLDLAEGLSVTGGNGKELYPGATDAAVEMFTSYLEGSAPRSPAHDLRARAALARVMIDRRRFDDAKRLLSVEQPKEPIDFATKRYYDICKALLRILGGDLAPSPSQPSTGAR